MTIDRFLLKPRGMSAGHFHQQRFIKYIAVSSNVWQNCGDGFVRTKRVDFAAADPRSHQNGSGQDSACLKEQLFTGEITRLFVSRRERVKRYILNHIATKSTLIIKPMWVPLSKVIIGALVDRMFKIECSRVDGQFVKQFQTEMSGAQNFRVSLSQDLDGFVNDILKTATNNARFTDIKRSRFDEFVPVGFHRTRMQSRDRTVADKIVDRSNDLFYKSRSVFPKVTLLQTILNHFCEKKWVENLICREVKKQILVIFQIRFGDLFESKIDHNLGLTRIFKG